MEEHLYPKTIKGRTYYYLQQTYRQKVDPTDAERGKGPGSGKSKVVTRTVYLGTAQSILERIKGGRGPVEVRERQFGFVAAIYQTARKIGLTDILRRHIPGRRFGIDRWLFFLLTILNRLEQATSKERMGAWAQRTVLPDLLGFDPDRLTSQTYWYVTDDCLSERELREARKSRVELSEALGVGIDDRILTTIEQELFTAIRERFDIQPQVLLYDTTNFFTYIEPPTPSALAQTGHNKDSRHHLRQVGLAMTVEKEWGIPLFHRVYRGNRQDVRTFSGLVDDLTQQIRSGFQRIEELVLVLDKGNNSPGNFSALKEDHLDWVGSLVPSHYPDLLDLPLDRYEGPSGALRFHRTNREVCGVPCVLVMTYQEALARKQRHGLEEGLKKLQLQVCQQWDRYRKRPANAVPTGIRTLVKKSRYGKCLTVAVREGQLVFTEVAEALEKKQRRFGKNLLFSNRRDAESEWIIHQYKSKTLIEEDFKLLKDPDLVRTRPIRHWTDTKIRAFCFCCVMALVLIRVMMRMAHQAGLHMSADVLKQELSDLKEVIMVHDASQAVRKVTSRSTIQQRLWELFDLGTVEQELTRHTTSG